MGKSSAVSLQLVYPKYDLVAESNVGHWPALFLNQDFLFFFCVCVCVYEESIPAFIKHLRLA